MSCVIVHEPRGAGKIKTCMGLYTGAFRVAEALGQGGVAVFVCRTDAVDAVNELVVGRARDVKEFESGTPASSGVHPQCPEARAPNLNN